MPTTEKLKMQKVGLPEESGRLPLTSLEAGSWYLPLRAVLFCFPYTSVFSSTCNYPSIVGSADKTSVVLVFRFLPDNPYSSHAAALGRGVGGTDGGRGTLVDENRTPSSVCSCPCVEFSHTAPLSHPYYLASSK